MDNPKGSPKSAGGKAESNPEQAFRDASDQVANAQVTLGRTQQEVQQKSQQTMADSAQAFTSAVQNLRDDLMKRSEEGYRNFVQTVQDAQGKSDPQKAVEDAYRAYVEQINSVAKDAQDRSAEAYRAYTDSLVEAQEKSQKDYADAYRAYLRSVQEAWTKVDVDAIANFMVAGKAG
jgi:intergrase/recombinase